MERGIGLRSTPKIPTLPWRPSGIAPTLLAGTAAVGAGSLAGSTLQFLGMQGAALAFVAVALLLGATLAGERASLSVIVVAGALLLASLVDLPQGFAFGPTTALGLLSLALVGTGLLAVLVDAPLVGAGPPLGFALYLLWGCLSFVWAGTSLSGAQTTIVAACFVLCICMGAAAARTERGQRALDRSLTAFAVIPLLLYSTTVAVRGPGEAWLISPRAFALTALVGLAWALARARYGSRRTLALVVGLVIAILFSLSRIAFVTALIVVPLAAMNSKGGIKRLRVALVVLIVAGAFYGSFTHLGFFRERFTEGDVRTVGAVQVNASGRFTVWPMVWESYTASPWVGGGAGSAADLTTSLFGMSLAHPHNDYLRILHDFGILGAFLWLLGIVAATSSAFKGWRATDRSSDASARFHLGAFLALIALSICMFTDNPISYVFVMAPAGVLIGAARGSEASAKHAAVPR